MTRNRRSWLQLLFLLIPALFPLAADAGRGTLNLERTAAFGKDLKVPDVIRSDCRLERKIIEFIEEFAAEEFEQITLVENAASITGGKALSVSIAGLSCAGGGAWSGPKHVTIEGTLRQDGKVIGTFTAHRVSSVAWGEYKGTCKLLARCARALGKDVAAWLKSPTMGAMLGDIDVPPGK